MINKGSAPDESELAASLGGSFDAFQTLVSGRAVVTAEWKRYGKNSPWSMKVSDGKRTLCYLVPQEGRFEVTVVLGGRAAESALAGRVRDGLHAAIRNAKPYAEGRPVRVIVRNESDLAGIEELIAVKLKP